MNIIIILGGLLAGIFSGLFIAEKQQKKLLENNYCDYMEKTIAKIKHLNTELEKANEKLKNLKKDKENENILRT